MLPSGYSPYQGRDTKKRFFLKIPRLSGGFKKFLLAFLGLVFGLLLLVYFCLGDLRFFAHHFFGLTFFNKDYLILLQNNYEARPGGGFITGYGKIGATMGFISDIEFHNSYEVDTATRVMAPYPQEELLQNEWYQGYTFRDANWDPDFPKSAQTLVDFYQQKFPDEEIDGIFVMNFTMIENLVYQLGGIEIDGETWTKENLFKVLTDTVNDVDRHDEAALSERKDILGELAANLMPKAKWHPFILKNVILEGLASKDLYLWFRNENLQHKIEEKGWANHMTLPENTDFLAVNIANLGSKKADRYLIKEVYHHINIKKEIPEATTEVVLRYPGSKNIYADDYKGYLRVYIPAAAEVKSELLGATVEVVDDFKVIGTKIILPAGGKTTLAYTYELPRNLLPVGGYHLRLIKQSGDQKAYTITAESNEDSLLSSKDFKVMENKALWQDVLRGDEDLSLELLADTSPPYPIEQIFENLNTIKIYWNEPIESGSGNDALNYSVTDENSQQVGITDTVKVIYAEIIDASVSRLELEGVTEQALEKYKITLQNIRDISGNSIDPNPKEITAVQRMPQSANAEVSPASSPSS